MIFSLEKLYDPRPKSVSPRGNRETPSSGEREGLACPSCAAGSGLLRLVEAGGGWRAGHARSPGGVGGRQERPLPARNLTSGSQAVPVPKSAVAPSSPRRSQPGQLTPRRCVSAGRVYLHGQNRHAHGEQHGVQGVLHRGPRVRATRRLQWAGAPRGRRHRHDRLLAGRRRQGGWPRPLHLCSWVSLLHRPGSRAQGRPAPPHVPGSLATSTGSVGRHPVLPRVHSHGHSHGCARSHWEREGRARGGPRAKCAHHMSAHACAQRLEHVHTEHVYTRTQSCPTHGFIVTRTHPARGYTCRTRTHAHTRGHVPVHGTQPSAVVPDVRVSGRFCDPSPCPQGQ